MQPYCGESISVLTSRLSAHGNNIVGATFLTPEDAATSSMAVATNGSRHLVVYQQNSKVAGVLLNDGNDPTPIAIADGYKSALDVMWNGSEFVVALSSPDGPLQLISISAQGTVGSTLTVPRDPDEHSSGVVFSRSFPAEQTTTPANGPPLAFLTQRDAYDAVPRAGFAFIADFQEALLSPQVPAAPFIGGAIADRDGGVTLTWAPQDHVLGFSIELRQPDGSERVIGVAAGSASSAHVSYAGMIGTALRLRAWNAAGLSSPSTEVQPATRMRAVGK
ncbi:MAG TPA: fibronectin type III domain-containing protein [Thermoanaerobaculia bacterium]|nr:fibronectin type III domain-containing protein [Thermoanaerobaculia bacterium]